ncbi:MAG: GspH/FimT family pseudopilin [Betaproteobacteria bacterium]|nr:GspH/FimT family pseudopilin [Betaproteobacteria bacterium]
MKNLAQWEGAIPKPRIGARKLDRTPRGFTLVELVMVLIIVGVLAVVALPRLNLGGSFSARGYADQVKARLQYAQELAVAQRRNVCVAVNAGAGTLTLTKALSSGSGGGCGASPVAPADVVADLPIPSGVTLSTSSTPIIFDALGQSVDGSGVPLTSDVTITITGDVNTTVTVEKLTGYVH